MTRAELEELASSKGPVTIYSIRHVLRSGRIEQITGVPMFRRPGWIVQGEIDGRYVQLNLGSKHVFAKRATAVQAARIALESQAKKYLQLAEGMR